MADTTVDTEYWDHLIEALTLLRKGATGSFPTHCEHDTLWVMANPDKFTAEEIERLDELSFIIDEESGDGFMSYLFGSA